MELSAVAERLRIAEHQAVFSAEWETVQASRPVKMEFLTPEYVRWACDEVHLPRHTAETVAAAARRFAADEAVSALAWYCHDGLFRTKTRMVEIHRWPLLTAALGNDAGMLNVVLLLSGVPQMQEVHRARGIPAEIVRETALDLKLVMEREDYTQELGHPGISPRILNWLMNHWRGELYRLGRLQYIPCSFHGKVRVFRHKRQRTVLALSEDGVRYRGDGQADGAGGVFDKEHGWTGSLQITEKEIVGHPILPVGRAVRKEIRLAAQEWQQALAPGDTVLGMHIPAGEPMGFEQCGESMARAMSFFPKYFPDKPYVALTCFSWILDAQFEKLLPPSSNLVRFQKEVYLFPIASGSESALRTVFGPNWKDWANIRRQTTMQRAFAAHIDGGGHFRGGACFLFPEDFHWGSRFYRGQEFFRRLPE